MIIKTIFDYFLSIVIIFILFPIILILFILCTIDTRNIGFFFQKRIGRYGRSFYIIKFRTYKEHIYKNKVKILTLSPFGKFLRNYKLDEIPQIINIILGDMSFVGPRPDVPGFADILSDNDKKILIFKPGITGLAQIKYFNEYKILNNCNYTDIDMKYLEKKIWFDKVKINKYYVENWSFKKDIKILFYTIFLIFKNIF